MFWNCLFRWKCNKFASAKSSPKCYHFWDYFIFSKRHNEPPKIGKKSPNLVTLAEFEAQQRCIFLKIGLLSFGGKQFRCMERLSKRQFKHCFYGRKTLSDKYVSFPSLEDKTDPIITNSMPFVVDFLWQEWSYSIPEHSYILCAYWQEEWRVSENILKEKSPNLPNWTVNKIFIVLFTI